MAGRSVLQKDIKHNILDQYASMAYHFEIYLLDNQSVFNGEYDTTDPKRRRTLAKSGTTAKIGISDVSFTRVVSPDKMEALSSHEMSITLQEYAGVSLLDAWKQYSIELGCGDNYLKVPVCLSLKFVGWGDGETEFNSKTIGTWIWPIAVTNITTNIGTSGATYQIDAVETADVGRRGSDIYLTDTVITLDKKKTVGETLHEFERILNIRELQKTLGDVTKTDEVRIVVADELKTLNMTAPNTGSSQKTDPENPDTVSVTINRGTTIPKAISHILESSFEYRAQLLGAAADHKNKVSDAKTSSDKTTEEKPAEEPDTTGIIMHITDTDLSYVGYDSKRNDYQKVRWFNVKPYNSVQARKTPDKLTPAGINKRAQYIANNCSLVKEYNYLFTGVSDQIIDFDLNIDYSYAINLPRQGGVNTNESTNDKTQYTDATDRYESLKRILSRINVLKGNATVASSNSSEANSIRAAIDSDSSLLESDKEDLRRLLSASKTARIPEHQTDKKVKTENTTDDNSDAIPVASSQGNTTSRQSAGGSQSQAGATQSQASTFLDQIYTHPTKSVISVEMTVRGDPHWLGSPKMYERAKKLSELSSGKSGIKISSKELSSYGYTTIDPTTGSPESFESSAANFFEKQNLILLNVGTPVDVEQGATFTKLSTISGVYIVRMVEHIFESGKFTQRLTCIIDSTVDVRQVKDFTVSNKLVSPNSGSN